MKSVEAGKMRTGHVHRKKKHTARLIRSLALIFSQIGTEYERAQLQYPSKIQEPGWAHIPAPGLVAATMAGASGTAQAYESACAGVGLQARL
jgi:hypothetical protein